MKILALVPAPVGTSPGQRFRIEQWEPHLRPRGVEIVHSPFVTSALGRVLYQPGKIGQKLALVTSAYARQCRSILRARRFDLVYVFREAALIGPAFIESLIAMQAIPVVFDFDDAVFVPYRSPSNGFLSYLKCFGKTRRLCSSATHVMAGNPYLAEFASRYNQNVTIIPTTIDTGTYTLREQSRDARRRTPVIGWTGSHSTSQHLVTAVPALTRLAEHHRFKLVVIGAPAPEIPGVEVDARPWRAETEAQDLRDIDIGIMPLPDDPWTRGKCGCKALQYMALGIPPVVSPVGVNRAIVTDGENGFLADGEDVWVERLRQLLENADQRRAMGVVARRTVVERYSAQVIAPRVYDVFQKALQARTRRADARTHRDPTTTPS